MSGNTLYIKSQNLPSEKAVQQFLKKTTKPSQTLVLEVTAEGLATKGQTRRGFECPTPTSSIRLKDFGIWIGGDLDIHSSIKRKAANSVGAE